MRILRDARLADVVDAAGLAQPRGAAARPAELDARAAQQIADALGVALGGRLQGVHRAGGAPQADDAVPARQPRAGLSLDARGNQSIITTKTGRDPERRIYFRKRFLPGPQVERSATSASTQIAMR